MCSLSIYVCCTSIYVCSLPLCVLSLYICVLSLYICALSLYMCAVPLYVCSLSIYVCSLSIYVCSPSIYMCVLYLYICVLRCDYCDGVHGVGIVNAVEVVRAFPSTEGLVEFRKWMYSREPFDFSKGCTDAELVYICVLILLCCASGCTRGNPWTSPKAVPRRGAGASALTKLTLLAVLIQKYKQR